VKRKPPRSVLCYPAGSLSADEEQPYTGDPRELMRLDLTAVLADGETLFSGHHRSYMAEQKNVVTPSPRPNSPSWASSSASASSSAGKGREAANRPPLDFQPPEGFDMNPFQPPEGFDMNPAPHRVYFDAEKKVGKRPLVCVGFYLEPINTTNERTPQLWFIASKGRDHM